MPSGRARNHKGKRGEGGEETPLAHVLRRQYVSSTYLDGLTGRSTGLVASKCSGNEHLELIERSVCFFSDSAHEYLCFLV